MTEFMSHHAVNDSLWLAFIYCQGTCLVNIYLLKSPGSSLASSVISGLIIHDQAPEQKSENTSSTPDHVQMLSASAHEEASKQQQQRPYTWRAHWRHRQGSESCTRAGILRARQFSVVKPNSRLDLESHRCQRDEREKRYHTQSTSFGEIKWE